MLEHSKSAQIWKNWSYIITELAENFFDDIQSSISNIEYFTFKTDQQISDQLLASLSSMKYLQQVIVESNDQTKQFYYNNSMSKFYHDHLKLKLLNSNCGVVIIFRDLCHFKQLSCENSQISLQNLKQKKVGKNVKLWA